MICSEDDPSCGELRRKLDEFYARTTEYPAFRAVNHIPKIWAPIVRRIQQSIGAKGDPRVRVLEVGAGMTGFPRYLGEKLRPDVHFTAQDVTARNLDHLREVSDEVIIGNIENRGPAYQVIFSTFVWEHLTNPRATLQALLARLTPGGSLFIACPHYDVFGYTPASAKHYSLPSRVRLAFWLQAQRAKARRYKRASFLIHKDPALLHTNWYRDADAIHWVSRQDLDFAVPPGYTVTDKQYEQRGGGIKEFIFRIFLLMFVEIRGPE